MGCDDGRAATESADSSDDGIRQSTNPYAEGARSFLASPLAHPADVPWFILVYIVFCVSGICLAIFYAICRSTSRSGDALLILLSPSPRFLVFICALFRVPSFGQCLSTASCSYLLCTYSAYLHLFIAPGITEIFPFSNLFFCSVDLSLCISVSFINLASTRSDFRYEQYSPVLRKYIATKRLFEYRTEVCFHGQPRATTSSVLSTLSFAIDKYRSEDRPLKLYRTTPLSTEVNKSQCFVVTGGGRHEKEGAAELLGSRTTIRRGRKQNLERASKISE